MTDNRQPLVRMRTWFGIEATIDIRGRSLHRAGFGKLLLPHPPAVNWLLRLGLPDEPYQQLSTIHEFGHFQTLPLMALYSIISGWILIKTRGSLLGIVAVLISIHATWEMLAESYVRLRVGRYYAKIYSKISHFPRLLFWILAGVISAAGWGVWFIRW